MLSIVIFKALARSTNMPCLGLKLNPYLCLVDNLTSGTVLPASSKPTRLSIHFLSRNSAGTLSATPSVNN